MKYFLVTIAAMFIAFYSVQACDEGYTQATFTFSYTTPNGTCDITVTYCYAVINGVVSINFYLISADKDCAQYVDWNSGNYWEAIYDATFDNLYNVQYYNIFPLCEQPPTINCGVINTEVHQPHCVKIVNECSGVGQQQICTCYMRQCEESSLICIKSYCICLDISTNPPTLHKVLISTVTGPVQGPSCLEHTPNFPPLLKTWNENWETPCFIPYDCQQP